MPLHYEHVRGDFFALDGDATLPPDDTWTARSMVKRQTVSGLSLVEELTVALALIEDAPSGGPTHTLSVESEPTTYEWPLGLLLCDVCFIDAAGRPIHTEIIHLKVVEGSTDGQ